MWGKESLLLEDLKSQTQRVQNLKLTNLQTLLSSNISSFTVYDKFFHLQMGFTHPASNAS